MRILFSVLYLLSLAPVGMAHTAPLPAFEPVQSSDILKSKEFASLANAFRAFSVGLDSAEGPGEARGMVDAALDSLGKKLGDPNPLREVEILAAAVRGGQELRVKGLRPGKIVKLNEPGGSFGKAGLDFAFRLPRDFKSDGDLYPLILSLPEVGQKPEDHLRAAWSNRDLLQSAILICPAMPAEPEGWDQTMVGGQPGGLSRLFTVLRLATERFPIDPDRIIVVGRGAGVPAAFAAGKYSPHQFAGIAGMSGGPKSVGPENFMNLPCVFFGGGADARAFHDKSQELGYTQATMEVEASEDALWRWIQERKRVVVPQKLAVYTGEAVIFNPSSNRVHWFRVAPTETGAFAHAEVNREENSILITSTGISHATLYLNDALVNLDQSILVTANGVTSKHRVQRSVRSLLDFLAEGTSDPGCVYTSELVVDVGGSTLDGTQPVVAAVEADFRQEIGKANGSVAELWALYRRYSNDGKAASANSVLRNLLRVEPNHEGARGALAHVKHGEQWFTSQAALDHFLWTQDEEIAKSKGHVLHKGIWMHPDDRAIANKIRNKDPQTGQWLTRKERKQLGDGWPRQDLNWIEPKDALNVDAGLWLVDGEWVDLASANRRHARLDDMWVIPGSEIWIHSTADRDVALLAQQHMTRALWDMRRVFGIEPQLPLSVAVLRDQEQYDRLAFGAVDGRRPASHAGRTQVIHHAYFAESRFVREGRKWIFGGMGVGYWEAQAQFGNLYGVHSARLAAGLAYVEGIDPSPKAIGKVKGKQGLGQEYYERYNAEKTLPVWLRYGGAVFAERYFFDKTVDTTIEGDPAPDPFWARTWSLENLAGRGGLRNLDEVFAFKLDPLDPLDGQKLLIEAGLLVSFMLDGECEPVKAAHKAFRQALVEGRLKASVLTDLADSIRENEPALRAYAGE